MTNVSMFSTPILFSPTPCRRAPPSRYRWRSDRYGILDWWRVGPVRAPPRVVVRMSGIGYWQTEPAFRTHMSKLTDEPRDTGVPAAGFCPLIWLMMSQLVVSCVISLPRFRPTLPRTPWAERMLRPTMLGTGTEPSDTTRLTVGFVEPRVTVWPAAGLWLTTVPAGAVLRVAVTVPTDRSALRRALAASACARPASDGTVTKVPACLGTPLLRVPVKRVQAV